MSERLTDAEALIWRIEGDPVLRSPILVVGLLDRAPSWSRVQTTMREAVAAIPRLHQRLDPGPVGARPRWVDDDAFSLEHHVRRVSVTGGTDVRAVLEIAEPDVMAAFDRARPLWRMTLVEGLEGGHAAFVLRFHHTITDGMGGIAPTGRGRIPARRSVGHRDRRVSGRDRVRPSRLAGCRSTRDSRRPVHDRSAARGSYAEGRGQAGAVDVRR